MFTSLAQSTFEGGGGNKVLDFMHGMAPRDAVLPPGWTPNSTGVPGVGGGKLLADLGREKFSSYGDGTYTGTRDLGDKYEVGLFDQSGNLLTSKTYDRDDSMDWAAKIVETVVPLGLGAAFGYAGLDALGMLGSGAGAASGATNAALIESAAGTAGYGASSAGLGGAAAGGLGYIPANAAGAVGGVGSPTSTAGFQLGQMAGGLAPGATGAGAAFDPIAAYLTTGGAEGSIMGNALTGAGGAAGAVGGGTAANFLGNASNLLGGATKFLGGGSSTGNLLNLGGNLLNSYLGYNAAGKAADAQIGAAREANQLQRYMFDTIRSDNMPALEARNAGLGGYRNLLQNPGSIVNDPGYQFQLQQGQNAYDNSGAARGMRLSGAQAKELARYGQNFAGTKLDQSLNRYGNLAGLGQVGSSTIAGAGQNYANQAGQNITGAGNAAASGYIGGANAIAGGVNNFLRNWQESNLLRQLGIGD